MEVKDVRRVIEMDGKEFDFPLQHDKRIFGIFRENVLLLQVQFDLIAYHTENGFFQKISEKILSIPNSDLTVVKLMDPILIKDESAAPRA